MSRSEDAGVTIRLMDVAEVQEAFAALGADRDEWRALARELRLVGGDVAAVLDAIIEENEPQDAEAIEHAQAEIERWTTAFAKLCEKEERDAGQ